MCTSRLFHQRILLKNIKSVCNKLNGIDSSNTLSLITASYKLITIIHVPSQPRHIFHIFHIGSFFVNVDDSLPLKIVLLESYKAALSATQQICDVEQRISNDGPSMYLQNSTYDT